MLVEILILRYWNGEITEEDLKKLRDYGSITQEDFEKILRVKK